MKYQRLAPNNALKHLIEFHEIVEVRIPPPHFTFLSFNHPADQGISIFYKLGSGYHQQVGTTAMHPYEEGKFYIQSVSTKGIVHKIGGEIGYLRTFFKPGKLAQYLGAPLKETTDQLLTLEDFGLSGLPRLKDGILNRQTTESRIECLEKHILKQFRWAAKEKEMLQFLTEALQTGKEFQSVPELCTFFGYSCRHLRRIFMHQAGIGPKAFLKLFHFKGGIQSFDKGKNKPLTQLAYDNGYADQAHFCRDFKSFLGLSPGLFKKKIDFSFAHRTRCDFVGLVGEVRT